MDMNLDLKKLIALAKPTRKDNHPSRYHRRMIKKFEDMHTESNRIKRWVDEYSKLPEMHMRTKMMIGRKIIHLEDKATVLEDVLYRIGYGEKGVNWPSEFEWSYCEDVIEACYDYIMDNSIRLLEEYSLLVFERECPVFQIEPDPLNSLN